MCNITENGWDDHKKLVYHKIDSNTAFLERVSRKQDKVLETIHIRDSKDMAEDMKRARFEARMEEKVNRMEKIVFGGGTAIVIQLLLNIAGVT